MNKFLLPVFLMTFISVICSGQYNLEVGITGLRNDRGMIMFQLLDKDQKIISQAKGKIVEGRSSIIINNLKPGRYAFRYFHDENLSGKMETGILGIPKEGCGFSNDAAGPFGPKPFADWLFDLNGDKKISARTRYWQKN